MYTPNSLWIRYVYAKLVMNTLCIRQTRYEYAMYTPNSLWIRYVYAQI